MTSIDTPQLGSIKIRFPQSGRQFDHFLSYKYDENFLVPADQWSFTLATDELSADDISAIQPGQRVEVSIDDKIQSVGYVDDVRVKASRSGGSITTVEGRDWMAPAVDSHVSPKTRFIDSMSLEDLLKTVFSPFGMQVLSTDNLANRNAIRGRVYGSKTSKKGKPLKSYTLHALKPYPAEGSFAFASRVSQRFGLWLWPATDFKTVIVGRPDFDQDPSYTLVHRIKDGGNNNVEESDVVRSRKDQPTAIYASGYGAGGEFANSKLRAGIINPIVAGTLDAPIVQDIIKAYPEVKFIIPDIASIASGSQTFTLSDPNARPLYLYDPESHTLDQLNAFLLRELSLRMRKSLTASYTIMGHTLNGQSIALDTIVDVQDERTPLNTSMWVIGRKFSKSASEGGTRTIIEAIRPGTLLF